VCASGPIADRVIGDADLWNAGWPPEQIVVRTGRTTDFAAESTNNRFGADCWSSGVGDCRAASCRSATDAILAIWGVDAVEPNTQQRRNGDPHARRAFPLLRVCAAVHTIETTDCPHAVRTASFI